MYRTHPGITFRTIVHGLAKVPRLEMWMFALSVDGRRSARLGTADDGRGRTHDVFLERATLWVVGDHEKHG